MKELPEANILNIEAALLDTDGSCRDVNFENPTWCGVTKLIRSLEQLFENRSAWDGSENLLNEPHSETIVTTAQTGKSIILGYSNGTTVVAELQIFVCSEEDGSPFIELTFFPQDILRSENLGRSFINWIDEMQLLLRSHRAYCRYENASWRFGEVGSNSGVFYVSDTVTTRE